MIDLAMHLMDIAQNSVRAKAQNVEITFEEATDGELLVFSVKDDGCGMNDEQVKKLSDPFFTTCTTRKVGLGIPFLKMTAEQTGGSLNIASQEGEGTTIEAKYHTNHPDCLPLGDLAGYVTLLIRANPDIRILFAYRLGDEEFVLDSKELAEQGIDIQLPEMTSAIKEFVTENLKEIFKKRGVTSFLC